MSWIAAKRGEGGHDAKTAPVDWGTPWDFFNTVNSEFRFDLDVCAKAPLAKCERFFTPEDDGLAQSWAGSCWMNPPYGKGIEKWMQKAFESARNGATVAALVFARTDTEWWQEYCMKAHEIRFLRGKMCFSRLEGGSTAHAPMPSALVIFRPGPVPLAPAIAIWRWKPLRRSKAAAASV